MIRAALIGVGGYGSVYLRNLLRLEKNGEIELVAVVIIHPKEASAEWEMLKAQGKRMYDNSDEFFKEEKGKVDLCCLPTGISSHKKLSLKALRAGFHVLVEKPAAACPDDIAEMARVSSESRLNVFVGFQNIYTDDCAAVKAAIARGDIGRIEKMSLMSIWPRSLDYYTRNSWAGKLKVGGEWVLDSLVHNSFSHFLNLIAYWADYQLDAYDFELEASLYRAYPIETFDTASIHVRKREIDLFAHLSHDSEITHHPEIRIEGTEGLIRWTPTAYEIKEEKYKTGDTAEGAFNSARQTMFDEIVKFMNGFGGRHCSLSIARFATDLAWRLSAEFAVQEIPAHRLEMKEGAHGKQAHIAGIEHGMKQAFEKGYLFHL